MGNSDQKEMTPTSPGELSESYHIARSGCVIINRSAVGRIWVYGTDRLDLLQRLSTNDLSAMALYESRPTVLTTSVGRIVDLLLVLNLEERALLLTSPGQSEAVQHWLRSFIFFQDDIKLQDATSELKQFGLYGTQASTVATQLISAAAQLPPHLALPLEENAWLLRGSPPSGIGYEVIASTTVLKRWEERALDAGAEMAPSGLHEILRVETGLPGAGHEIEPAFIPLEVGLREAISFSKGCYTGQEIIARMDTRGKLAKTMVGLRSRQQLPRGAALRTPNGSAGMVTSTVHSPRLGWIGLALVKPAAAMSGAEMTVGDYEPALRATVTALPFDN